MSKSARLPIEQKNEMPRHVAIVMDGNGRWAKKRHMPRIAGHRVGEKAVRKAVAYADKIGIEVLSIFALSVENFTGRPQKEVKFLLSLFAKVLIQEVPELHSKNIRVRVVGDLLVFDEVLRQKIIDAQVLTEKNTGLTLVIAANYSGRWDIFQAAKKMAELTVSGDASTSDLTENDFVKHLCWSDLPDPDLLIRTSGEQRISNFMLWQLAYTELCFIDELWPDFDDSIFERAIAMYQKRERRFGYISEQLQTL